MVWSSHSSCVCLLAVLCEFSLLIIYYFFIWRYDSPQDWRMLCIEHMIDIRNSFYRHLQWSFSSCRPLRWIWNCWSLEKTWTSSGGYWRNCRGPRQILYSITVVILEAFIDKMFLITFVKNILNVVGILLQALEDLSKAIKLEPTPDLLHERGTLIGSETGSLYLIVWAADISCFLVNHWNSRKLM
jgi:hypothetical protein